MRVRILACAMICGILIFNATAWADVAVDQPAPDFTLTGIDGQSYTLSDYKGKRVVLEWTNYDCPFVRKHYDSGNMQALQKKYAGDELIWFSICSSAEGKQGYYTPESWREMVTAKTAAPTAVLLDPDGRVGRLYQAKTTPHMYIIDPDGMLVYRGAIDSIASANPADIAKAENYVEAALNESLAGRPIGTRSTKSYGCSVKY